MARRKERLAEAAGEAGPDALAIPCDVTDEASCRQAIEEAAREMGGIDALVYATGIGPLGGSPNSMPGPGAACSTPTSSAPHSSRRRPSPI